MNVLRRKVDKILNYAKEPKDGLCGCTPFAVVQNSPMITLLSKKMRLYFDGEPSDHYDVLMDLFRESIIECGLEPAYVKPEVFSIVPYYAWTKPIENGTVTPFDKRV